MRARLLCSTVAALTGATTCTGSISASTLTRTSTADPFGNVRQVSIVSTAGIDWPAWLSPTGCELYYINKPFTAGAEGQALLYVARLDP